MKKITSTLFVLSLLSLCNINCAQDTYLLWENGQKPFYLENALEEYESEPWGIKMLNNITEPTLTVYRAKNENTGKAVIIIPGGGYSAVALYHEGYDLAKVVAEHGITAAVLKYRLPNPESSDQPEKVPLSDSRRALKLLREKSADYGIDENKVGVLGFSAGSHLSTVTSLWLSEDSTENPDFSALIYGVTDLNDGNLKWLEESLYYRKLTEDEIAKNTLLELVNENTPPAFLVHAYDDEVCKVTESTLYAQKLFENNVPVEMHLFPTGGHGFGMGRDDDGTRQWVQLFINWLKQIDF